MNLDTSKLIISVLIIVIALVIKLIIYRILKGVIHKFGFRSARKAVVNKIINFILFLVTAMVMLGIWEVNPNDLALYFASIFTMIGIAFFAQWSHLSNITAGLIIFFSHPAQIGDSITLIDGDNTVEGEIVDSGLFFITITNLNKNKILFSNTLFLQKMVSINSTKTPRNAAEPHLHNSSKK